MTSAIGCWVVKEKLIMAPKGKGGVCAALGCHYYRRKGSSTGSEFYRFPKDAARFVEFIDIV